MSQNTSPVKVSVDLWKDHQKNIYDCSENDNEFSGEEKSIAKRWKSAQKTIYRYDIIVIKKKTFMQILLNLKMLEKNCVTE